MQMQLLTAALSRLPEFQQLLTALEGGRCPAALSGAAAIHRAHIAAGLALKTGRPVVVVCADESEGERMARDLAALSGKPVPMLTPRSFTFHNAATVSRQWEQRRLAMLRGLSTGELTLAVATVEGLMQRTMEPEVLGPAPAPVVKLNNRYRYRITVVGQNEKPLRQLLAAYMKAFARRPEHRNMAVHTDCNLMD